MFDHLCGNYNVKHTIYIEIFSIFLIHFISVGLEFFYTGLININSHDFFSNL